MSSMSKEESLRMFRILPKDIAADVFGYLEPDDQQYIIRSLSDKEAAALEKFVERGGILIGKDTLGSTTLARFFLAFRFITNNLL